MKYTKLSAADLNEIKTLKSYINMCGTSFQKTNIPNLVEQAHQAWEDADYHEMQSIMAYLIGVLIDNVNALS